LAEIRWSGKKNKRLKKKSFNFFCNFTVQNDHIKSNKGHINYLTDIYTKCLK
jgi:hypothetical protein